MGGLQVGRHLLSRSQSARGRESRGARLTRSPGYSIAHCSRQKYRVGPDAIRQSAGRSSPNERKIISGLKIEMDGQVL
jgi:hypothetical protein